MIVRDVRPADAEGFARIRQLALPFMLPFMLRTGADFADNPRPLFALYAETLADGPSGIAHEFTDYEAWLRETPHLPA